MENDLRLMEIQKKDGLTIGIKEIIGTIVTGSILVYVGMYTNSKVSSSIDRTGFSTAENTTFDNVKTNVNSGFDLSSVLFIVLAAAGIVGVVLMVFS